MTILSEKAEHVVLLHGLGRSARQMAVFADYLASCGYVVHNIAYPSRWYPVEELCEFIHKKMVQQISPDKKVHFVGFSLGGLLVRLLLSQSKYRPTQLGRVVQLASPNQGTDLADLLKNNWLYKQYYGPAGQQITTNLESISHLFSPIDYELGILAGTATADPISSMMIKGKNDGRVSVENTKVDGMKEHKVLHVSHRFFPKSKTVMKLTAKFLKTGVFG